MSQKPSFWDRILSVAKDINTTSYYELLGLEPDASADDVREAYYKLVRVLHPDRHARQSRERREALTKVYARIGEAHRVLSNPATRAEYDQGLGAGKQRHSETPKRPLRNPADPSNPQAKKLFEEGQRMFAAGNKKGARSRWELAQQFDRASRAIADALEQLDEADRRRLAPAQRTSSDGSESGGRPPQRRASTRHPLARPVKIRCKSWEKVETVLTRDISRGGMFLRTPKPLEVGTPLVIILKLPDERSLEIDAEVAHAVTKADAGNKDSGMGVRFVDAEAKRQQLEAILARARG